jgi:hypothetical protein
MIAFVLERFVYFTMIGLGIKIDVVVSDKLNIWFKVNEYFPNIIIVANSKDLCKI